MRIAVVGGTGDFGLALAERLVAAGEAVVIGSRDADRAREKAAEVGADGAANEDAVRDADLVVLAVKAEAALPTACCRGLPAARLRVTSPAATRG